MGRPGKAVRARLISIILVLGVVLSSVPLLDLPLAASGSPAAEQTDLSPATFAARKARDGKAQKQTRQNAKGKKDRGKKNDKNKNKHKGSKNKKRKGNRKVAPELDAKLIAAENQQVAEDILTCDALETVRVEGRDLCTHGEDPRSFSRTGSTNGDPNSPQLGGTANTTPLCIGNGQDGPRVQLIYVHANNAPNRINNLLPTFRRLASEMDTILDQSARKTGGSMRIRFATSPSCQVDIPSESVQGNQMASFGGVINTLKDRGYGAPNRKYLLLVDTNAYCGIGSFQPGDDANTKVHDTALGWARVDVPCWDAGTMLHELSHTLGAVQNSAPNSSKGAHCIDEWDVMCYSDSPGLKMKFVCEDGRQDFRLDCGNNDYFAANPDLGSYLANHWNMARSVFFTDGTGQSCVDAPTEPDDAYWYAFWDVPLPLTKVGATEQRAFCTEPGDTDWLLFTGEQGGTYEITTSDLGPGVDTQLVVYRGFTEQGWNGMDRLGSNNDHTEGDPSSQVTFTAPASGSYLIGVSDAANRAGYDATYTIAIQSIPTTGAAALDLSRPATRPNGKFTATMTGITSGATVQFFLERNDHTTPLGNATASDAGVASALLSIPKGAGTGHNIVEAAASDGSSATAPIKVKKNGGRKNKGGKHKRNKPGRPKKKH